jgi:hypothetical protein
MNWHLENYCPFCAGQLIKTSARFFEKTALLLATTMTATITNVCSGFAKLLPYCPTTAFLLPGVSTAQLPAAIYMIAAGQFVVKGTR